MNYQIPFTFVPCQSCNAKIHCDQCALEAAASLSNLEGVSGAVVDMKNKTVCVDGTINLSDLEVCMEDIGLLPD